jgi:hypothetical protein
VGLRDRFRDPDTLMRFGMATLIVANVARYLLHPTPVIGEDLIDGAVGFLFGVAIGTLLLSVWRRGRGCARGGPDRVLRAQ